MKFREVAHFYLGVEVQTKIRLQTRSGEPLEIAKGKLVCVDLFYENSVDILLDAEKDRTHYQKLDFHEFKPLLLSLEDMTKQEIDEYNSLVSVDGYGVITDTSMAQITHYLTSKHYDVFGLCDSGQAIRKKIK